MLGETVAKRLQASGQLAELCVVTAGEGGNLYCNRTRLATQGLAGRCQAHDDAPLVVG